MMAEKGRIFVVEDHATTARALKMYLETQGYTVTLADNIASALKVADQTQFDLLICDLSLPDGTGWDLMKKLCAKAPVRGIAYTASGSAEDVARSEKVGFLMHMVKGCSTEELMRAVEQALKKRPKKRAARSQ